MKTTARVIPFINQRSKISLFAFFLFVISVKTTAQPFAPTNLYNSWNGSNAFTIVPTASGLTFSQFSRGTGIGNPAAVTSGITSNGWDGTTSLAGAEAANKYFTFSITSNATNAFNVSGIFLSMQRSPTGPANFQMEYSINGSPFSTFGNAFSTTSSSTFSATVTAASLVFIPGGQNIVFRLYGWNATGTTGTCRINNNTSVSGAVYTLSIASLTGAPFCVSSATGAAVSVNYSANGTYTGTNVFTAQLSDASGSFAAPLTIGTLNGSATSGTINAIIPAGTTPGSAYRIRVVSDVPVFIGSDNGTNISIATSADVSTSVTNLTCNSSGNGEITSTVTGGISPYSYSWSTSATTASISGLTAGTYTLTVTDNAGCNSSVSVTVTQPDVIVPDAVTTDVSCNGGTNGGINLSVSGGTSPYSFAWSNSSTSQNISNLSSGTYSVVVTDNNNCTQNSSVTISEPAAISISPSSSDVNCNGGTNGTANLSVGGGTSPYSFAWSNSSTSQNLSNLAAGTYSVVVTDNNNCTQNSFVTISEPAAISISPSSSDVNCNGGTNGTANLSVGGGTSPYSFAWSNSSTSQNLSNLAAGTYSVVVTDNNNCTQNSFVTISEPTAISVSPSSSNVNCNGGTNGTANLSVSGGTSPYSFLWSNSSTSQNLSNLTAGAYSVVVTDNNNCMQNSSVIISEPTAISVSPSSSNVNCNGGTNGTANLSVSGGTSPYSFLWSNSSTSQNLSNLAAGTYSVVVTDNNNCTQNSSVIISEPVAISILPSSSNVNCNGGTNGTANLSVSGGTSPYSFLWSNSSTSQNLSNLTAGAYSVVVTDNNNCTQNSSVIISEPVAISILPSSSDVNCNGGTNGTANLSVSGGTSPYSFLWSNSSTSQNLLNLAAGTYSVVVTDNNNCVQNATVTITEPSALSSSSSVTNASCGTCADGDIDLNVSGGTAPYNYTWSNSDNSQDISSLLPGIYYVSITDANGCALSDSATVNFSTGIPAIELKNEIAVYPNPSSGENIHIVFQEQNNASGKISFAIFDLSGKEVYETELNSISGECQTNLLLPNGTYLYKLEDQKNVIQSGRLVILK